MTLLEKPVRRKTRGAYSVLYSRPRQIVVSLMPGDFLEFREAGRRAKFTLTIDGAFKMAARKQALELAAEKKKQKKLRRKLGEQYGRNVRLSHQV